MDKETMKHLDS